jgi:hypothetical protein
MENQTKTFRSYNIDNKLEVFNSRILWSFGELLDCFLKAHHGKKVPI